MRASLESKDAAKVPGAGTYKIPGSLAGSKWSMGEKLDSGMGKAINVPGPGNYELQNKDNIKMKSAQRYSVGHSKRDGLSLKGALNVPGPGNYSMNMSTSASSPRYGFGSSKRGNPGRLSGAPGPGNYAISPRIGNEGLKMSIHSKLKGSGIGGATFAPGPGTYNSSLSHKKKEPAWGSGTSKRPNLNLTTLSPGSAAYNPNATFTTKKSA